MEKQKYSTHLIQIAAFSLIYYLAGKLGFLFSPEHPLATPVWPPSGLSIAALLLFGFRLWPAITLGAFCVNAFPAGPLPEAIWIACGNTIEAVLGAYLIVRFAAGKNCCMQTRHLFLFTAFAFLCTFASSTIGVTTLILGGEASFERAFSIWLTWWLGDVAGILLFTPLALFWFKQPYRLWPKERMIEGVAMVISLIVTALLAFGPLSSFDQSGISASFLCIPPMLWAALRFGRKVTATMLVILLVIALWGTVRGIGPFAGEKFGESLLFVQIFAAVTTIALLTTSSVIAESRMVEEGLRATREGLERRVMERTEELSRANAVLRREIQERERAEEEIRSQAILRSQVQELARRTEELTTLNTLGELMLASRDLDEAYAILPKFLRELFPEDSGSFYVLRNSGNQLDPVASWGKYAPGPASFTPEDCWALRRGSIHHVEEESEGACCEHLHREVPGNFLCIPVVAGGGTLGLLYMFSPRLERPPQKIQSEYQERLAKAFAQQLGISLMNIRFRESLKTQASRDSLTDLFNRRYLEESFPRELNRMMRRKSRLGLLIIDIDHFKKFNDRFGHATGDYLLRGLSDFLTKQTREEDILCRFGGEEFVLVFSECEIKDVKRRAEEIRSGIKKQVWIEQGRTIGPITLSIGIAFFPDHGDSFEELFKAADLALYRAKKEGRDRVRIAVSSRVKTGLIEESESLSDVEE